MKKLPEIKVRKTVLLDLPIHGALQQLAITMSHVRREQVSMNKLVGEMIEMYQKKLPAEAKEILAEYIAGSASAVRTDRRKVRVSEAG